MIELPSKSTVHGAYSRDLPGVYSPYVRHAPGIYVTRKRTTRFNAPLCYESCLGFPCAFLERRYFVDDFNSSRPLRPSVTNRDLIKLRRKSDECTSFLFPFFTLYNRPRVSMLRIVKVATIGLWLAVT